jgi:hypothetical protein
MQDICPAPKRNQNIFIRVLHDACVALGGEHQLAEYLGVKVRVVELSLKGHGQPPDFVFLRCCDLLYPDNAGGRPFGGKEPPISA